MNLKRVMVMGNNGLLSITSSAGSGSRSGSGGIIPGFSNPDPDFSDPDPGHSQSRAGIGMCIRSLNPDTAEL
uniref:Uncharacterized protein n=1 Tax=Meloidogyne incognita TaxID=6306 RepID=A0A914N6Z1_MELIC